MRHKKKKPVIANIRLKKRKRAVSKNGNKKQNAKKTFKKMLEFSPRVFTLQRQDRPTENSDQTERVRSKSVYRLAANTRVKLERRHTGRIISMNMIIAVMVCKLITIH